MLEKLKRFLADDTIFTGTLLCVIAVTAFFLGRFSLPAPAPAGPVVAQVISAPVPLMATTSSSTVEVLEVVLTEANAKYVGSKSGTKYHLMTCSSGQRIKPENRVFFATKEAAEAAGYAPASNCPGL
ncbi:MAG: hypothetical protein RLZZ360_620 [Candidatus Parcubacteria bacterium]|jgi:hypothetical protein